MALDPEKFDIEVRNDDAIKRNQIFFDLIQRTFNCLDLLNLHEIFVMIKTIKEDQSRNQSAAEIEKTNREKNPEKK